MSTQYPPPPPGGAQPTMPPPPPGQPQQTTDVVSVLGLVFAFLAWPIGLVLSVVGLTRTGRGKRGGRGLAVAGLVVSLLGAILTVVVVAFLATTAATVQEETDQALSELEAELEQDLAELEEAEAALDEASVEDALVDDATGSEESEVTATVALGEPAEVEGLTFTVTSEECGLTTIGDDFLSIDAQGVFCLYDVTVENGSNEPYLFDSSGVTGFVGEAQYDASGEAAIYLEDNDTFLTNVNPGNTVEGTIVFDVPDGAQLDRLELSPGFFSSKRAVVTLR